MNKLFDELIKMFPSSHFMGLNNQEWRSIIRLWSSEYSKLRSYGLENNLRLLDRHRRELLKIFCGLNQPYFPSLGQFIAACKSIIRDENKVDELAYRK